MKTCSVDDCPNRAKAKGLCNKHYLRKWKHGDPTFTLPRAGGAKHGMFGTPTWNSWSAMKNRCLRPTCANWRYYGGRGITICDRWLGDDGFTNFLADLGERPAGMSLDRIDSDGNYEPSNCRWSTASDQMKNRRPFKRRWAKRPIEKEAA